MEQFRALAIGGNTKEHTGELLARSLEICGAEKPNVVLVPSARPTPEAFDTSVKGFGGKYMELGALVTALHDFDITNPHHELEDTIMSADVLYVHGGDTRSMMRKWNYTGITDLMMSRLEQGAVLAGISAGAIAPFTWGHSDSESYHVTEEESWDYIAVSGLGIIPAAITPHNNTTPKTHTSKRSDMFRDMLAVEPRGISCGFGIDNNAALEILGNTHGFDISVYTADASMGVDMHQVASASLISRRIEPGEIIHLSR